MPSGRGFPQPSQRTWPPSSPRVPQVGQSHRPSRIADWAIQFEDSAETLRGVQVALFGGTPDQVPERYRMSSPMTYAEQVRAPILVIQGENDTRTPARQLKHYEEKLNSLGKPIEVHWFNAGHGSRAMEQQIEHQELMLRFAYRVLG